MSNNNGRSHKTQSPLTQRDKDQTRAPQHRHAYMYTRHNHNRHATQHNAHKHVAQAYLNPYCYCNYMSHFMSHSMTQKNYRKHPPLQKHKAYFTH